MADFYPLISRAVAALERNDRQSRRELYYRARAALLQQLLAMKPALREPDIRLEQLNLEEAIQRVETEYVKRALN
jgi:hypothetical protein